MMSTCETCGFDFDEALMAYYAYFSVEAKHAAHADIVLAQAKAEIERLRDENERLKGKGSEKLIEAAPSLLQASTDLVAYVRDKYNVPADEQLRCPYMQQIESVIREAEKEGE